MLPQEMELRRCAGAKKLAPSGAGEERSERSFGFASVMQGHDIWLVKSGYPKWVALINGTKD